MFCPFHFYLWLPSPLKPRCEIKNTSVTRQEGRAGKLKKRLTTVKSKTKEYDRSTMSHLFVFLAFCGVYGNNLHDR